MMYHSQEQHRASETHPVTHAPRNARAASEARRLRRRRQNHEYLDSSSRSPSLFTLRW